MQPIDPDNPLSEPFPDLDSCLLLDHGNVLGPLLKCVYELRHDASSVLPLIPCVAFLHVDAIFPSSNKLQNERGGAGAVDHLQNSSRMDFNI